MTDDEVLAKAHRAYNELVETKAIFDKMRESLVARWAATGIDSTDHREKLFNNYATINAVERALREAVDAGKYVEHAREAVAQLGPR